MHQVDDVINQSEAWGIDKDMVSETFSCRCRIFLRFCLVLALPQKTANQPSARTMTGLRRDPSGKMRLYVFGFTRNNA